MKHSPLLPFLLTVLLLLAGGRASAEMEFEYGKRPPLSVFDPAEVLDPATAKKISDPLKALEASEGVDVIAVVLTDLGAAPPEHVAQQFAEAWCKSAIHCVILHVPGHPESPWIFPRGKLVSQMKPEEVVKAVAGAERRARAEPKDADKVRAAAIEATDMLRFWLANGVNRSERIRTHATAARLDHEMKERQRKILAVAGAAGLIPLVLIVYFGIIFLKRSGPRYFPNHAWQLRLGAPHAGGNQAVADIGPPLT